MPAYSWPRACDAQDEDALLACMASQAAALDKQCEAEAQHRMSACKQACHWALASDFVPSLVLTQSWRGMGRQAHQAAARAAKAEMDALLEARSASEQAYIDRAVAASEESQNALQEQRTADAEEFKALKSRRAGLWCSAADVLPCLLRASVWLCRRLEEQLHVLEAEAGIMRATYQVDTEKLVYNCRVLGERAQESAAVLSQQKRRQARQRDVLSGIKVCSALAAQQRSSSKRAARSCRLPVCSNAMRRLSARAQTRTCARPKSTAAPRMRSPTCRTSSGASRMQTWPSALRCAWCPWPGCASVMVRWRLSSWRRQVWSMKIVELEALGGQLLDADRCVVEQQLGWSWDPPQVTWPGCSACACAMRQTASLRPCSAPQGLWLATRGSSATPQG